VVFIGTQCPARSIFNPMQPPLPDVASRLEQSAPINYPHTCVSSHETRDYLISRVLPPSHIV
jgi:hypothetical protein